MIADIQTNEYLEYFFFCLAQFDQFLYRYGTHVSNLNIIKKNNLKKKQTKTFLGGVHVWNKVCVIYILTGVLYSESIFRLETIRAIHRAGKMAILDIEPQALKVVLSSHAHFNNYQTISFL